MEDPAVFQAERERESKRSCEIEAWEIGFGDKG